MEKPNLEQKIEGWLETQGFPLEMVVARSLISIDGQINQSTYYLDIETKKPREIDIISRWYKFEGLKQPLVEVEIESYCCIECKSQQKKPWIIFYTKDESSSRHFVMPHRSKKATPFLFNKKVRDALRKTKMLNLENVGHGITQAFTTGKDVPFEARMSAAKCASYLTRESKFGDVGKDYEYVLLVTALPIVITDGMLFEYVLNEDNETTLREIDFGVVEWKYPINDEPRFYSYPIFVYTENALPTLLGHIAEVNGTLLNNLDTALAQGKKRLVKRLRKT